MTDRAITWPARRAVLAVGVGVTVAAGAAGIPEGGLSRVLGTRVLAGAGDSGNGKNKGSGNDSKDFVVTGTASGLYPGAARPLPLTLRNDNNFPISVTLVRVAVANAGPGCPGGNVTADPWTAPVVVPGNGTAAAAMTVRMAAGAPDACKNAVFQLTYSGTAVKS